MFLFLQWHSHLNEQLTIVHESCTQLTLTQLSLESHHFHRPMDLLGQDCVIRIDLVLSSSAAAPSSSSSSDPPLILARAVLTGPDLERSMNHVHRKKLCVPMNCLPPKTVKSEDLLSIPSTTKSHPGVLFGLRDEETSTESYLRIIHKLTFLPSPPPSNPQLYKERNERRNNDGDHHQHGATPPSNGISGAIYRRGADMDFKALGVVLIGFEGLSWEVISHVLHFTELIHRRDLWIVTVVELTWTTTPNIAIQATRDEIILTSTPTR
jgi:hypothetical protein